MRKVTGYKCILLGGIAVGGPIMMKLVTILSQERTSCIFDALGGKCLGCNIRGALYQLSKGHMVEAFRLNALVYVWILFGICVIVSDIYVFIRRLIDVTYRKDSFLEWFIKKMFKGVAFEGEENELSKVWSRD